MATTTLEDLVLAYRKAKVDLYYSSDPRLVDLVEYEEDLSRHLESLLQRINGADEGWVTDPDFVGSFTLMPKGVVFSDPCDADGIVRSDPRQAWADRVRRSQSDQPRAEFRLMSMCSIDMHVLSALWVLTAGEKMEARLSGASMGSRLRRTRNGTLNRLASGSFKPYLAPYREWRDGGMKAMKGALAEGKSVIALTADVTSFYHRLNPNFLLDRTFLHSVLKVPLGKDDGKIHRLFVNALRSWSLQVARDTGWQASGLPVGLPASAVVANLALVELDRLSAEEFKPIYYGRYVDDILLVIEDDEVIGSRQDVWDWLIARSNGLLSRSGHSGSSSENQSAVRFAPSYLDGSQVIFGNGKCKVFHLTGSTGEFLLGSIRRAIDEQASEWRSLPSISPDANRIGTDIAVATRKDGDDAATLRDADRISARRAGFAIRLRNFEAYERNLDTDSWTEHRVAFVKAVCEQILVMPKYFDLAGYVSRLIKLVASCGDLDSLARLFASLGRVHRDVVQGCDLVVREYSEEAADRDLIVRRWGDQLVHEAFESLASGLAGKTTASDLKRIVAPLREISPELASRTLQVGVLRNWHRRLFVRDLAHVPFRFGLLGHELVSGRGIPPARLWGDVSVGRLPLARDLAEGLDLLVSMFADVRNISEHSRFRGIPGSQVTGLVFATRPFNMLELYLVLRDSETTHFGVASADVIKRILLALRGFSPTGTLPGVRLPRNLDRVLSAEDASVGILTIPASYAGGKRRVSLSMLQTEPSSLEAAALGRHDLGRGRFEQLSQLFNEIMSRSPRAHYALLPELAIPSTWFVPYGLKLQERGINLIAGIEYCANGANSVRNQVWAALRVDGLGFPAYVVYTQDKQRAAPWEEQRLHDLAQLTLEAGIKWQYPPVIVHGDFRFSIVICSELTNIAYRSFLRGKIDALFVPEWNQDLNTFEALVESAALDIHAYVAQSNHRKYGDSRLRAPRSESWQRDVAQVRGGTHDYAVVAEIDFWSLREHQSAHRSAKSGFKPVPDGFVIAEARRRLPKPSGD